MTSKCIAIGSGKGGVGKSTTTINIALSLAAAGERVAIVDLDPLSNIATILDIATDMDGGAAAVAPAARLADISMAYVENCDILFPNAKSVSTGVRQIVDILFGALRREIAAAYDVVLIDMPAGIADDFFIDLIPHIQHLIVVVVPEPPAHISAAGFVKAALQINPAVSVYFWHNKFQTDTITDFNAYTVIENYHRYVDKEQRFTAREVARCRDIAYVPHEQILDLLRSSLHPNECVWSKARGILSFFYQIQVQSLVRAANVPAAIGEYMVHYLLEHRVDDDIPRYVANMVAAFDALRGSGVIAGGGAITLPMQKRLMERITLFSDYPLYRSAVHCIEKIDDTLRSDALSGDAHYQRHIQVLENHIVSLLKVFDSHRDQAPKSARHCAALLSVYLSFSKLLRNDKVRTVILRRIPTRTEGGRVVRDRRQQIAHLISRDSRMHSAHLQMIKQIYPIIIRQMMSINSHYKISTFNFMMTDNTINTRAYLQLISHITHEIIHCGLGVIIGIPTSRTYASTKRGSEKVRALVA